MKNHDFCENPVEINFSQEIDFLRVEDPQNPFGSCAARNVQNFGGATCSTHKWECSGVVFGSVRCFHAWCFMIIENDNMAGRDGS